MTENTNEKINLLEERSKTARQNILSLNKRMDKLENDVNDNNKKINDKLDYIKDNQHNQDINNLNLNNTLSNINEYIKKEKDEKNDSKKDMKQIKYIVITAGLTFASSLIIAIIQILF